MSFGSVQKILVVFFVLCVASCWTESLAQNPPMSLASSQNSPQLLPQAFAGKKPGPAKNEQDLVARVRAVPKAKMARYKLDAAKQLQANLVKTFQALSNNPDLPSNVRTAAKSSLTAAQSGKLTPAIVNNLPAILQQASPQQGRPAEQLQTVLSTLIPNVGGGVKGPLEGLMTFVAQNTAGVNTLLIKVLGGAPDLLAGTIKSLTTSLGAVSEALNGSLGSLGGLLGGALG